MADQPVSVSPPLPPYHGTGPDAAHQAALITALRAIFAEYGTRINDLSKVTSRLSAGMYL